MATRRLLSLFRGLRASPRLTAGLSNRVIPLYVLSERSTEFSNKTRHNQWPVIAAMLFTGQTGQGENQKAALSNLQRVEDGTIVSNDHTVKWRLLTDSGRDIFSKGKLDEAEKAFELALKEAKLGFGLRDPHVASACNNLAELKRVRKQFEESEPLYLEAISILEESFGPNDVRVAATLHNLGQFYLAQHKLDKAHKCYEVLYLQGKEKDAEALIRESISILEENGLGESPTCVMRMATLSQIMLKSKRPSDAEMLQRKILHALELSKVASTMLHLARLALYDSKHVPSMNGDYSDSKDGLIKAKQLLDDSIRIAKGSLRRDKSKTYHIHVALLLYLQALDTVGLLESKRHEMLLPEGRTQYPFEAEHALKECISIYNEPQIRSILLNAADAKAQYITCLNRLSIMIREGEDQKTRTETKDLVETVRHIRDELLPKKNKNKSL